MNTRECSSRKWTADETNLFREINTNRSRQYLRGDIERKALNHNPNPFSIKKYTEIHITTIPKTRLPIPKTRPPTPTT